MNFFQTVGHLKGKLYSAIRAVLIALPFLDGMMQKDVTEGVVLTLQKMNYSTLISIFDCLDLLCGTMLVFH